jgi:hypothetical protein
MIVLIGSKPCLVKGSLRNSARRSKFGTSCVASRFGPFEHNDHVFNHGQWHESKVIHQIWNELIIYAKAAWERVINQIKTNSFSSCHAPRL